jgi:hypothetical protein
MSQENVEVAKAFYDAYNARNSEALDRLLHPEADHYAFGQRRARRRLESGDDEAVFRAARRDVDRSPY